MAGGSKRVGKVLRFVASGGMADEDPETVDELLTQARQLANMVLEDEGSSPTLRTAAAAFLAKLQADTFSEY